MKTKILFFLTVFTIALSAHTNAPLIFKGSFTEVISSHELCNSIFSETQYQTRFYHVGSSRLDAVIVFQGDAGFLKDAYMTGRYGYRGDVIASGELIRSGVNYLVYAEGIVDYQLALLDTIIQRKDENGKLVCEARGTYSAFR